MLFLTGLVSSASAQSQKKTPAQTKRPPVMATLRDREYEDFLAAHPSNDYFGAILPRLLAGKSVRRTFHFSGNLSAAASVPLTVRVTSLLAVLGEKPKALSAFERNLPSSKSPQDFTLDLPVPNPATNVLLEFTVAVRQNKTLICQRKEAFLVIADGKAGSSAQWLERDDKTQGDWLGVYGKEAFLVDTSGGRSVFQIPNIMLNRGVGEVPGGQRGGILSGHGEDASLSLRYARSESQDDKRLPQYGPGQENKRPPVAFAARETPLVFRAEASDGLPHTVSLYVLDYKRADQTMQVDIYDFQRHHLDTRKIEKFGEGAYLRYRFAGQILITVTSLTPNLLPTTNALFVDP